MQFNDYEYLRGKNLYKKYQHDAGWDICAPHHIAIPQGESVNINTGLHIYMAPGLKGVIQSRSGLAVSRRVEASNAGVIDHGYTGAVIVKLYNHGGVYQYFEAGDRIAQILFDLSLTVSGQAFADLVKLLQETGLPKVIPEVPMGEWPDVDRGDNGIGSTGVN